MKKFDFKAIFKPGEFDGIYEPEKYANLKIWAILQCERRAYASLSEGEYHGEPLSWRTLAHESDTHHGIVINLGRIEK